MWMGSVVNVDVFEVKDVDVGHGYVEDDRRSKTRKSCKCLVRYTKHLAPFT
jgi:hypothetical protein